MKRGYILASLTAMGFLLACNSSESGKVETPASASESFQSSPVTIQVPADSLAPMLNTGTGEAGATPQTGGTVALNPAHGQPGHRCDIAIGAPLNSAPTKVQTPATTTPQAAAPVVQPQSTPVQTTTTQTAPGMNPPHGQPGHRCDIAIGAPLDSAPAK